MSKPLDRRQVWFPLLSVLLLFALGGASWTAYSAARSVRDARKQLDECLRLGGQIVALREAPDKVEEQTRGHEELSAQLESWCRAAGIQADRILSISPLSPRRIAESDYQELGAEVDLGGVTLAQLAALSDQVAAADDRLRVSDLQMLAPRDDATDGGGEEAWNAKIALTYLLYSPKSPRR